MTLDAKLLALLTRIFTDLIVYHDYRSNSAELG